MKPRRKHGLSAILAAMLMIATSGAWAAHPVTAHDRTATTHDRGPQYHDHSAATRRGR